MLKRIQNKKSGFTLIELLVVIAIIGILASIVLASLNTARNKGADAAIKGDLSSVRVQAALYYDNQNPNSYGPVLAAITPCPTTGTTMFASDITVKNAIAGATTVGGAVTCAAANASTGVTSGNADTWAIHSTLKSGSTWCVDSGGQGIGGKTAQVTGATPNFVASCQ